MTIASIRPVSPALCFSNCAAGAVKPVKCPLPAAHACSGCRAVPRGDGEELGSFSNKLTRRTWELLTHLVVKF